MLRLRFVWLGKTKSEPLRALVADYQGRLERFVRCETIELKESASRDARVVVAEEASRILGALRAGETVVALDVEGEQWSSPELAAELEKWETGGVSQIAFVIGGHLGVSDEVKRRADVRWSLGRLTLTHEMARVIALEQIYRAYTIRRGLPYQK